MKQKNETTKASTDKKNVISSSVTPKVVENDEGYRQINIASFQTNFKALIGHYKVVLNVPQVG